MERAAGRGGALLFGHDRQAPADALMLWKTLVQRSTLTEDRQAKARAEEKRA